MTKWFGTADGLQILRNHGIDGVPAETTDHFIELAQDSELTDDLNPHYYVVDEALKSDEQDLRHPFTLTQWVMEHDIIQRIDTTVTVVKGPVIKMIQIPALLRLVARHWHDLYIVLNRHITVINGRQNNTMAVVKTIADYCKDTLKGPDWDRNGVIEPHPEQLFLAAQAKVAGTARIDRYLKGWGDDYESQARAEWLNGLTNQVELKLQSLEP